MTDRTWPVPACNSTAGAQWADQQSALQAQHVQQRPVVLAFCPAISAMPLAQWHWVHESLPSKSLNSCAAAAVLGCRLAAVVRVEPMLPFCCLQSQLLRQGSLRHLWLARGPISTSLMYVTPSHNLHMQGNSAQEGRADWGDLPPLCS